MPFFHRFLQSKIATIVFLVLLILVCYQTALLVYKGYATESDVKELRSRVVELTEKRSQLLALKEMLKSDYFAEREGRLKLGLQKQGERVLVLPESSEQTSDSKDGVGSTDTILNKESVSGEIKNTTLWWKYFFGRH